MNERINDEGENLFRQLLSGFGLEDETVQDCWDERTKSQRRYRREMRYYADALRGLNIDPGGLTTYQEAERSVLRALRWLKVNTNLSAAVIRHVKSTVCVTFSYQTAWPRMTASSILRATLFAQQKRNPTVVRPLQLDWTIKDMWRHYRQLPPLGRLPWDTLVSKTIVLTRVFGRLRYTELEQLDAEATEPDAKGWRFVTQIKLHKYLNEITIDRLHEEALDPVRHLLQLRDRIRRRKGEIECMEETTFWMKENGEKMTYGDIRRAVTGDMEAAGIKKARPHQLKHAAITELQRRRVPEEEIVAFARHKPGSKTWAANYLDTENSRNSIQKLVSLK